MNKKIIEKLLEEEKEKLTIAEIRGRFCQRKVIEFPNQFTQILGGIQSQIKASREFIKFLEEIKEE